MKNLKCQLFIYLIFLLSANSERNFRVVVTSISCFSYDPEYISNATCILVERNGNNYVNGILTFNKSINKFDFRLLVDFLVPNRSKLTLVDVTLDGCMLLKERNKNKLVRNLLRNLQKFLNAPLECPLKANFSYIIKNYIYDADDLPTYVPSARFRFTEYIIRLGKILFKLVANGEILHKGNKKGK